MSQTSVELNFEFCENEHALYQWQKYFIYGFKALDNVSFRMKPFYSAVFSRLAEHNVKGDEQAWTFFTRFKRNRHLRNGDHVGRYAVKVGNNKTNIVIDGHDGKRIRDPMAYEWADIYFKSNMWGNMGYPEKVRPITTGDISLTPKRIEHLKSLRRWRKKYDLCFMSRIWEGDSGNPFDMVEHQVRLFEALSQIECDKKLVAVIDASLSPNDMQDYLARLDKAGVAWRYRLVPLNELWSEIASSQITFFRPGKHLCMPGRMLEYLAMGACVVFDRKPFTQWYQPLTEGEHFLACDSGLNEDESLPPVECYGNIKRIIDGLLSDSDKIAQIKNNNIAYFDQCAAPSRVAQYVLDSIAPR